MAYVDPNTVNNPAPGQPLPAALLDLYRENFQWLAINAPKCRASRGTAQEIADNTGEAIELTTESFDIGGMHSTSSNPSRIIVPSGGAGFYLVGGGLVWETETAGYREIYITQNGSDDIAFQKDEAEGSGPHRQSASGLAYADEADYFEVKAYYNASGTPATLDVIGAYLWVFWVGTT